MRKCASKTLGPGYQYNLQFNVPKKYKLTLINIINHLMAKIEQLPELIIFIRNDAVIINVPIYPVST